MCDIKTKLRVKEITGYKVVIMKDGNYILPFYKAHLKLGSTKGLQIDESNFNRIGCELHNHLVKEKSLITAFKTKKGAVNFHKQTIFGYIIIKIKFGGEIYSGTGKGTCFCGEDFETIAGDEILEMSLC